MVDLHVAVNFLKTYRTRCVKQLMASKKPENKVRGVKNL